MLDLKILKRNGSKAEILGREIWHAEGEPTEKNPLLEGLKMGVGEACEEE